MIAVRLKGDTSIVINYDINTKAANFGYVDIGITPIVVTTTDSEGKIDVWCHLDSGAVGTLKFDVLAQIPLCN